jgi:hypothetical protein
MRAACCQAEEPCQSFLQTTSTEYVEEDPIVLTVYIGISNALAYISTSRESSPRVRPLERPLS